MVTTTAQTITQTRYINKGRPAANSPTTQVTQIQLQLQIQLQVRLNSLVPPQNERTDSNLSAYGNDSFTKQS